MKKGVQEYKILSIEIVVRDRKRVPCNEEAFTFKIFIKTILST